MGNAVSFPRRVHDTPRMCPGRITQSELQVAYELEQQVWTAFRSAQNRLLELKRRVSEGETVEAGAYRFDIESGKVSRHQIGGRATEAKRDVSERGAGL